ncbi:MAG TPA: FHA domain-containing protein [Vicinamibacterales bacterium]|nr:FHA domain-containing protein [Vicinamibacterales bacterium]
MDLLRKARDLEARIAGTLDRTVGGLVQTNGREPIEVMHAVVDAVQTEIQSSGRGRRVFPFNAITLTILAPSRDARARFEAVFADGPTLRDRIRARLQSAGCQRTDLDVAVTYETKPRKTWKYPEFDIVFARVDQTDGPAAPPAAKPRIEVTILHGTAERRSYSLTGVSRIDIGRCAEVRDSRHRLIRTNHVAFVEGSGDSNQTVSRRHAHIAYEPASGAFRLRDDGSEHGTGVVRNGRTVSVPRGSRGIRLESGDEIVLGAARLRVKFGAAVA